MRKSTWMAQLERALSREGMTGTEKRTVLNYYEEMYQDRLDDGAEEEDIIKEFGFPEDVAQSVREHDEMSAKDEKRKSRADRRGGYDDYTELNLSTATPPQPQYGANSGDPYAPNGAPNYAPNGNPNCAQNAQNAPNTPSVSGPPASTASPKSNVSAPTGIARTVIYTLIIIIQFVIGIALAVGGAGVIIAAFAVIAFSTGVWLIAFGVGLVILAIGCLIICSAVKLIKSETKSSNGGAK